jgi:hypothetical protein
LNAWGARNTEFSFDKDSLLDRTFRTALAEEQRLGTPERMANPLRAFLLVFVAQGIIDNGGLQYFFENDFLGQPPYSLFVDAYREIGAPEEASELAAAAELFPFPEPHKQSERRNAILDKYLDGGSHRRDSPFEPYTHLICGNEKIFPLLLEYVQKHAAAFSLE